MQSLDNFLEEKMGVSPHFFSHIKKDDDWACIIKLASLIEASMNHLLVRHFKEEKLSEVFSQMDLLDKRRGKIAFISALELLPKEYRGFVHTLAQVRNAFAHQISTSKFRLKEWIASSSSENRNSIHKSMVALMGGDEEFRYFGKKMSHLQLVQDHPRLGFTVCAYTVLLKVWWDGNTDAMQVGDTIKLVIGSRREPRRSAPKGSSKAGA